MTDQPDHHVSKDGSSTLYSNTFNQYYHNPNGAVAESRHVFFETPGFPDRLKTREDVHILEVGFGTGLNFLLSIDYYLSSGTDKSLTFHSIEAFPIQTETAAKLNYAELIGRPELKELLPRIFTNLKPGLNVFTPFDDRPIQLRLFYGPFEDFSSPGLKVDFIFHDAFSPEVNEELWTDITFGKLMGLSGKQTVLSTYCAASQARGAMAAAGWKAARARGALGKREMTLASPEPDQLKGFKRLNEERLAERYRNGAFG